MWQFVGSLTASIVVALLTVQLSLRRFYREKWWERRLDAYTRVIDALQVMWRDLQSGLNSVYSPELYDKARGDKLKEKAHESREELMKVMGAGELLLSEDAMALLRQLIDKTAEIESEEITLTGYAGPAIEAIRSCHRSFIVVAKRDLRLSPGVLERLWHRASPKQI